MLPSLSELGPGCGVEVHVQRLQVHGQARKEDLSASVTVRPG
jgi:hypothetical protein